jgi:DNA-binding Lrp family transcriptional regulator
MPALPPSQKDWTFLTNHGHVLVCVANYPDIRISQIADLVGVGERAAHRILDDLVRDGYVKRKKSGRRNVYSVNLDRPLRHPLEADHSVGEIFRAVLNT